jgi:hypothetical protein
MLRSYAIAVYVIVALAHVWRSNGVDYKACPTSTAPETRELYVATCDTRAGWKEFMAMRSWNVTGEPLRQQGLPMINVCKGKNWGEHGFLTKPLLYLDYIRSLPAKSSKGGEVHVILMDSDTFWSVRDISSIWAKFDCARGTKDVLLSTEMSCWVGRYCDENDMKRWYSNLEATPSYSPFANSGAIIGLASKVQKMLEYVVAHNTSYLTVYKPKKGPKFDDQYAIADYAISVAPEDVMLDYHQALLASFSLHAPAEPYEDGWPFACKWHPYGNASMSCVIWTGLLAKHGFFRMSDDCILGRHHWSTMPLETPLKSLAPDPILWHGNGVGKRQWMDYGHRAFMCQLDKRGMTETDWQNTFG